jgi:hypothetical protein
VSFFEEEGDSEVCRDEKPEGEDEGGGVDEDG